MLDTEPETHLSVYQHLDKFIIADDVTLSDETEMMSVLAIEGPESTAIAENSACTLHWRRVLPANGGSVRPWR